MKKLINLNLTGVTRGIPLMKQYRNLFIILTVALFLTACGGGGGTAALSTSSGGGGGGGTTAPPVVQKDIATLVMEAETAVGEIDAVNPTQVQVDAANTAIMAANDAIGALEAGDEKTMHMTRLAVVTVTAAELAVKAAELAVMAINATEPTQDQVDTANTAIMAANTAVGALEDGTAKTDYTTDVTVAGQRVSIFTAIMAADMAVKALEPLHEVTKAKVEAANQAINNIIQVVSEATAVTDGAEIAGYLETASMLGKSDPITMARTFVANALGAAETAKTDAMTAETSFIEAAANSPAIAAFEDGTTLSVAMGVSKGITADAMMEITALETEINKIERQLLLATRAKMNLDDDLDDLEKDLGDLKEDLGDAQGKLDNGLEEDVNTLLAESLWYDEVAGSHEAALGLINVDIAALEQAIANADAKAGACETGSGGGGHAPDACTGGNTDSVLAAQFRAEAAQHRMELEAIKTGETKYTNTLKIIEIATETTNDHEKGDVIGVISDDEKEYTYDDLKTSAGENRQTATDRQTEHGTKEAELTATNNAISTLPNEISTKETEIADKEDEVEDAQEHVDAIEGILVIKDENDMVTGGLRKRLADLQGVVGDDATAAESAKAQQVLNTLVASPKAVGEIISDLDTEDYVFARAVPPDGAMTFETIARAGVWSTAGGVFHTRTIVISPGSDPLDTSDDVTDTSFVPANHPAIALASLEAANFDPQGSATVPSDRNYREYHHGQLNGIEGTLYCDHTSGCSTGDNGFFGEGWYFTPAVTSGRAVSLGYNPTEVSFVDSDNDGTYEVISYVDYGMWLTGKDDDVNDPLTIHRRAGVIGPAGSVDPNELDFTITNGNTDTNATYSGDARGLSARTVGTGDDAVTASGHFIADVEMEATFGASPTLEGTIDNFRVREEDMEAQGSGHVNPAWSLTLSTAPLMNNAFDGRLIINPGSGSGSGSWDATPYGDTRDERPDGFYGGFDVRFWKQDGTHIGAATGVYSTTEKVESE